jgi:hypothetical protein
MMERVVKVIRVSVEMVDWMDGMANGDCVISPGVSLIKTSAILPLIMYVLSVILIILSFAFGTTFDLDLYGTFMGKEAQRLPRYAQCLR